MEVSGITSKMDSRTMLSSMSRTVALKLGWRHDNTSLADPGLFEVPSRPAEDSHAAATDFWDDNETYHNAMHCSVAKGFGILLNLRQPLLIPANQVQLCIFVLCKDYSSGAK